MYAIANKIKCISAKKAAKYVNHIFYMSGCSDEKELKELRALKWLLDSECEKSKEIDKAVAVMKQHILGSRDEIKTFLTEREKSLES